MKKIILLLLLILNGNMLYGQFYDKLTPRVKAALQEERSVEVIIVFKKQFDSNKADSINGKFAKGAYVQRGLIQVARESQASLRKIFDESHVQYRSYYIINAISAEIDRDMMQKVASLPEVKGIYYNSLIKLEEPVTMDERAHTRSIEWGIKNIKADSVWLQYGVKGAGAVIGGQDTGYDWDHEALKLQYRGWNEATDTAIHDYNWHDAIDTINPKNSGKGPNPCGLNLPYPCDDHGHGTHTMGTMVGYDGGNNHIGVAPEAEWIGCRNMERGWGTFENYMECFEWFIAPYPYGDSAVNGDPYYAPDVINNSWGCPLSEGCDTSNFPLIINMLQNVRNSGIVIVVSAGNTGSACSTINVPALFEESFAVGASNSSNLIAGFSSRGPVTIDSSGRLKPDVAAPGVGVRSSTPGDGYGYGSGTSMAGPHVAGTVALLISAVPSLAGQVDSIESILQRTARPHSVSSPCGDLNPGDNPNNEYGYGIINALEAVREALGPLPLRMLKFTGYAAEKYNHLQWETVNEVNFSHFVVQRSTDGLKWVNIGRVSGSGNSTGEVEFYSYVDRFSVAAKNYYRLKQIDRDGQAYFSSVILLYRSAQLDNPEISLYPNPATDYIAFSSSDGCSFTKYRIKIFNMLSQMLVSKQFTGNRILIDLSPGIYFYRLKDPSGYPVKRGKLIVR